MSLSRRQLLRGSAGMLTVTGFAGLNGCATHPSTGRRPSSPPAVGPTSSHPAAAARPGAVAAEQGLLAAYAATLMVHPELTATLATPIAHHRAHTVAFGGAPTPSRFAGVVPADPRAALTALAVLEQQAGVARQHEAIGDLALGGVLAAVGAAELVHVDLLARVSGAGG